MIVLFKTLVQGGIKLLMLNDEICKLREELNESITTNQDYSRIYKLSVQLDGLIANYYGKEANYEDIFKHNYSIGEPDLARILK